MNIVHLSGTAASSPLKVSRPGESTHVTFPLNVTHHTKAGIEKHESYFMNAWRGIGDKVLDKIANGSNVVIQGYLSQSWNNGVPNTEVTITEFVASPRAMIVKKSPVITPATQVLHEKQSVSVYPAYSNPDDTTGDEMVSMPVSDTHGDDTKSTVAVSCIVEETEPENELPVDAEGEETAVLTQLDDSEEQAETKEVVSEEESECKYEQTDVSSGQQCA